MLPLKLRRIKKAPRRRKIGPAGQKLRLNLVEEENNLLKEKIRKIEEEKMILELHVADVVDDLKIKMDAMRLRLGRLENMMLIKRIGITMSLDQLLP